ncbi:MAG: hypothetical protein ACI97A_000972 [Planctomycetota bacterium]|jgi:hypothetical protein
MSPKSKLTKKMSVDDFDCGYWYALELKEFAKKLGISNISKLRKDEIEKAIRTYLRSGKVTKPTKRALTTKGIKDSELGLQMDLPVVVYTNNSETRDYIETQTVKLNPDYKIKSGARLRLNRWREEKMTAGSKITYGELVQEYVRLSKLKGPFKQLPSGRYINFLSNFHQGEKGATREEAMAAWHQLKKLDIPKDYRSWSKWRNAKK